MHCISSIQVKQQRLLRICYEQTAHIFTGMSYELKATIEKSLISGFVMKFYRSSFRKER